MLTGFLSVTYTNTQLTKPVLSSDFAKSFSVGVPLPEEVHRPILPALDHLTHTQSSNRMMHNPLKYKMCGQNHFYWIAW